MIGQTKPPQDQSEGCCIVPVGLGGAFEFLVWAVATQSSLHWHKASGGGSRSIRKNLPTPYAPPISLTIGLVPMGA